MTRTTSPISVAALALALALTTARDAPADTSLHTELTTSTGVSTYVNGISDADADTSVNAGAFLQLAPGVVLTSETSRLVHVASYVFQASLFAGDSGANSFSNRINYQGVAAISPRTNMSFGASASNGQISTLALASPADEEQELLPQGDLTFLSMTLQQGLRRQITRDLGFVQEARFRTFLPISGEADLRPNYVVRGSLSTVRRWQRDALQLGAETTVNLSGGGTASDGTMLRADTQVQAGPEVRWLRDLSARLSTDLQIGVLAVVEVGDAENAMPVPTGTAALRYEHDRGSARLSYRHRVQPNLFVSETTVDDVVSLSGGLPLPWVDNLSVAGTVSYSHGRLLDVRNEILEGTIQQIVFDTSVAWEPIRGLALGARLQAVRQSRDANLPGTTGTYVRTQALLSLTARYPTRQAATIPFRDLVRADSAGAGFGEGGAGGGVGR